MTNFRVGQKVVCIEEWHLDGCGFGDEVGPVAGGIYIIREFAKHPWHEFPCVRLVEISNPVRTYTSGFMEICFRLSRFRPVSERKTDIGIFKAMLVPSKRRIKT